MPLHFSFCLHHAWSAVHPERCLRVANLGVATLKPSTGAMQASGGFLKWGIPKSSKIRLEHFSIETHGFGYQHFRKPPCRCFPNFGIAEMLRHCFLNAEPYVLDFKARDGIGIQCFWTSYVKHLKVGTPKVARLLNSVWITFRGKHIYIYILDAHFQWSSYSTLMHVTKKWFACRLLPNSHP